MPDTKKTPKHGQPWTREELIVAFDLYCRIPFNRTKANNPDVIEIAAILERSPASVARKLGNFGSLDPILNKRKVSGLSHTSKMDRQIWNEFHNDWNHLVLEAERLKRILSSEAVVDSKLQTDISTPGSPSEKTTLQKTRIHQSFFREAVLGSYESRCCITGLRIKECLIASHIIPWRIDEKHRADPRNGLCLSATFDRLFDRGLLTITDRFHVAISSSLLNSDDPQTVDMICSYHDVPINKPRKFFPLTEYLEWQHENVFRK